MNQNKDKITVYYDGACPSCVKDRHHYEKLAGRAGKNVSWFDITGQEERLREIGIDPYKALMALHLKDENQQILSEMDAYIMLLNRVTLLKPLAWLIGLPLIRPILSKIYRRRVDRRLQHSGRLGRSSNEDPIHRELDDQGVRLMANDKTMEFDGNKNRRIKYCQNAPEWAEHARFDALDEPCDDGRTGRICGNREGEKPCPI